ncbi:hypothetical protein HMPREF0004_0454 [Achromobacter piechaudii ATCC 43553]|uniref:Uncharacterized protein n=1 Tax=Achromobacter piechaudii ATCC 43553 TaxID=742159 RepID=D4X4Q7_9BURK|nr:hypothetical protein HMPREF0004_0454 [Achromobacter piechaudii ATCC 43553]
MESQRTTVLIVTGRGGTSATTGILNTRLKTGPIPVSQGY